MIGMSIRAVIVPTIAATQTITCPLCDHDIGSSARASNGAAVEQGLLFGCEPGTFCPKCLTKQEGTITKRWLATCKAWLNLPEGKRI